MEPIDKHFIDNLEAQKAKFHKADRAENTDKLLDKLDSMTGEPVKVEIVTDPSELAQAFYSMLRGPKGETGETGEQGPQGEPGLDGADSIVPGPVGPQGPKGDKGDPGLDGLNGFDGRDGIDGIDGLPGKDGSPDLPKDIVQKLESLQGSERLSASAVKDLQSYVTTTVGTVRTGDLIIQDEGAQVEQYVKFLNFVGAGVQVAKSGDGRVTVTISGSASNESNNETPSGAINGSNVTFTLAQTPNPAANLKLFLNGQLLTSGGIDYTLATATITMVSAPQSGNILRAYYQY